MSSEIPIYAIAVLEVRPDSYRLIPFIRDPEAGYECARDGRSRRICCAPTPLPYADQERLVLVWGDLRNRNVSDFLFAPGDFYDSRQQATMLEQVAAVTTRRSTIFGDDHQPEQVRYGWGDTEFLHSS